MQVDVDDVLGTHERDLHRNIRRIRLDGETGNVIGKVRGVSFHTVQNGCRWTSWPLQPCNRTVGKQW